MQLLRICVLALVIGWVGPARGNEVHDLGDDPKGHRDKTMYEVVPLGTGENVDPALGRKDLDYIDTMNRHHEGAQAMSRDYLADPRGTNQVLRKLSSAIINNQGFELAVLAAARESVAKPPVVWNAGFVHIGIRELGIDGLEHRWRFMPWPAPSPIELALLPRSEISEFDVAWAKGMTMHHQAAVDMAWAYNRDHLGRNRVLRLMNLDIIREQRYEIGLLDQLVARYPGDETAIQAIMPKGMPMGSSGGGRGLEGGGQGGMPGMSH